MEVTLSCDIEDDDLDHHQDVLHLGQLCWDKSSGNRRVPLAKEQSCADTVIARPPLPISRKLPAAMTLPLLKHQKSSQLNILSVSDHAPSALALVLSNRSTWDQNIPQLKASRDQNFPQCQMATFEVGKRYMGAIVFTRLLVQYYWMTSTRWLKELGDWRFKSGIVSRH
jgi:hypothetical protein